MYLFYKDAKYQERISEGENVFFQLSKENGTVTNFQTGYMWKLTMVIEKNVVSQRPNAL